MQSQVQLSCLYKEEGSLSADPSLSLCPSLAELEGVGWGQGGEPKNATLPLQIPSPWCQLPSD